MKILYPFCVLLVLSACAAHGPAYTSKAFKNPPSKEAQVIIYRPADFNSIRGPTVFVNGEKVCELRGNVVTELKLPPGKSDILLDASMSAPYKATIDLKPGKRYYVRILDNNAKMRAQAAAGLIGLFAYNAATHDGGNGNADWRMDILDPATAQKELPKMSVYGCG